MKKRGLISGIAVLLASSTLLSACAGKPGAENSLPETVEVTGPVQNYDFPDFDPVWGKMSFPGEYNKEKDVVIDYAYSDGYFDIPSSVYNPSLATMSLCLELSAWASYETDLWEEKSRNARKLLEETGFTDFAQNEFWSDKPSTESIGVVAAHKELEDCTLIALPVRGGKYYNEWGSNVAIGIEGAHTGFAEGRDNVLKFLEQYIEECGITGRVKLWVVGYSRGGAVANLVAGYLNENPLPNGARLDFDDLYCYAFEAPQGILASEAGDDISHANIHNIINPNDLIPLVAPRQWDFTRYNSTSRLIPTVTTSEYQSALETMLEEYDEILAGVEGADVEKTEYMVSEYAKKLRLKVNPLSFLPSGEPFVEITVVDDTSQTMNEVLTGFVESLVSSIDGREEYYGSLQADLVHLLDLVMGYETGFDIGGVLGQAMEVMSANGYEKLKYILGPTVQLNDTPATQRIDQVVARLHEVLPQPEGFNDIYAAAGTLIETVGKMLVEHPEDVMDVALAFTNSKLMQSHYEEITLAWMRAGDPHYTDTPFTMVVPETLRTVRVNFPVDLQVYDSRDQIVAQVVDRICSTYNSVVGCAINDDGEIVIHLPADEAYRLSISSVDEDFVSITLSEYNLAHSRVSRVQNYAGIAAGYGDVFTLDVPSLAVEEFTDENNEGSTANYRLLDGENKEIPCSREDNGQSVEYFQVSAGKDSPNGIVSGGGSYLDGSYALVEAQPLSGSSFEGWYVDGALVSNQPQYRFPVEENIALTASFSEVPKYALSFGVSGDGTIANASQTYSAGSVVQLSAAAAEGYAFDHWEASSGSIGNAYAAESSFVVGNEDAYISAVFVSENCPGCDQMLYRGESHKADCVTDGHYSCDEKNHQRLSCGHYGCADGTHTTLACGHYSCSGGTHSALTCGHYSCSGGTHSALTCGHYSCSGGTHSALACGHYSCSAGTHSALACGHYSCGAGTHDKLSCGHYSCSGGTHSALACGHYSCSGGTHSALACGHYSCSGGTHSALACGHYSCSGGTHSALACGHYSCSGGTHSALACGHYSCSGGTHSALACGHYSCSGGTHSTLACGHYSCSGGTHSALACGHYSCSAGTHTTLACGHYSCSAGTHDKLSCGHYSCSGGTHSALACGHYSCSGGTHSALACGHHSCDGQIHTAQPCGHLACATGDHSAADCGTVGHYACDGGDHSSTNLCGHYSCSAGIHSALACGHYSCSGGTHTTLACGHYSCSGGTHTTLACGHYSCSGGTHSALACGHHSCDGQIHTAQPCGHLACATGDHSAASCGTSGHYACDGGDHSNTNPCGHLVCATGDHSAADCGTDGHYACDGGDHSAAPCGTDGHFVCDALDHTSTLTCGHYVCATGDHGAGDCGTSGHYVCDGLDHGVPKFCKVDGHYYCDGLEHDEPLPCWHFVCQENDMDHREAACGEPAHFYCNYSGSTDTHEPLACGLHYNCGMNALKDHSLAGCGHYVCDGGDHSEWSCGNHYKCDGTELSEHAARGCGMGTHRLCDGTDPELHTTVLDCGHKACVPVDHSAGDCGIDSHYNCNGDHSSASCGTDGHYGCDGNDHSALNCGHYTCAGGEHDAASCGTDEHYICDSKDHSTAFNCGHYACASGDHSAGGCGTDGHYNCDGQEHVECEYCGSLKGGYKCDGNPHGSGVCLKVA